MKVWIILYVPLLIMIFWLMRLIIKIMALTFKWIFYCLISLGLCYIYSDNKFSCTLTFWRLIEISTIYSSWIAIRTIWLSTFVTLRRMKYLIYFISIDSFDLKHFFKLRAFIFLLNNTPNILLHLGQNLFIILVHEALSFYSFTILFWGIYFITVLRLLFNLFTLIFISLCFLWLLILYHWIRLAALLWLLYIDFICWFLICLKRILNLWLTLQVSFSVR
jgi:hypothetical protein